MRKAKKLKFPLMNLGKKQYKNKVSISAFGFTLFFYYSLQRVMLTLGELTFTIASLA